MLENIQGAIVRLRTASQELSDILADEMFMSETPLEVDAVMSHAVVEIEAAIALLDPSPKSARSKSVKNDHAPTYQQGQFLAFIKAFTEHSYRGIAPTHAELQRYFGLSAPSVNSMLKRLEQLGYIERVPGVARAIKITIAAELIPELERPIKFLP